MKYFGSLIQICVATLLIEYGYTCQYKEYNFRLSSKSNRNTYLEVQYQYQSNNLTGPNLKIFRDGIITQEVEMYDDFGTEVDRRLTADGFELSGNGNTVKFTISVDTADFVEFHIHRDLDSSRQLLSRDCIYMTDDVHWYGGPKQKSQQYWPINVQGHRHHAYVPRETDSMAIAERYWLNSAGTYIYFSFDTPLFMFQLPFFNICFESKKNSPYNMDRGPFVTSYFIGIGKNPKESHLQAVKHHLGKPTNIPDEKMATHPIWSTWARYKRDIDENLVEKFANEILDNNFENSQIEIDDDWEECYGSLTINKTKFPDMKGLVQKLKAMGYRVTIWIHPFINKNCQPWYDRAISNRYVVFDNNNNPDTKWWNSEENEASYIDFTKPTAVKWFTDRLNALKDEYGFDSFKFDAGETSWAPNDPILQGEKALHPSFITRRFCKELSQFGSLIELRTGWGTQDLPHYVRMLDKDTYWDIKNNGLESLVTTLLVMNINGYPFVLPDMVGGNGYNEPPSKELFIRWLEATVFMPSIQFSYVPWDYDVETIEISKRLTKLHETVAAPEIIKAMKKSVEDGTPVNPPIWWIAPQSAVAHDIGDQFLLGETILVAPVLKQGITKRDIYLPTGTWKDGNGESYSGNSWIKDYPAPLGTIPYFVFQTSAKNEL